MMRDDHLLAANYVMGLLDDAAHAAAERRMQDDAEFVQAVHAWRERFADLDASADETAPSAELWKRIADDIKSEPVVAPLPGARAAVKGATLWDNLQFWRLTGIAATAAALSLAIITIGALGTSKQLRREIAALVQSKPVYVALLVSDTTRETGAVVNAFANGRVELIPLKSIEVPAGRALQVWTLWDRAVGPKPIGLSSQSTSLDLDLKDLPDTAADQLFEITLEPEGGSPIGRPTGPVLYKGNTAKVL